MIVTNERLNATRVENGTEICINCNECMQLNSAMHRLISSVNVCVCVHAVEKCDEYGFQFLPLALVFTHSF